MGNTCCGTIDNGKKRHLSPRGEEEGITTENKPKTQLSPDEVAKLKVTPSNMNAKAGRPNKTSGGHDKSYITDHSGFADNLGIETNDEHAYEEYDRRMAQEAN